MPQRRPSADGEVGGGQPPQSELRDDGAKMQKPAWERRKEAADQMESKAQRRPEYRWAPRVQRSWKPRGFGVRWPRRVRASVQLGAGEYPLRLDEPVGQR